MVSDVILLLFFGQKFSEVSEIDRLKRIVFHISIRIEEKKTIKIESTAAAREA